MKDTHGHIVNTGKGIVAATLIAAPAIAFAAPATFAELVVLLVQILNLVVALLTTVALAVFFWGMVKYFFSAGGGEGFDQARQLMLWGIIALFVLVCVFGITQVFVRVLTG